MNNKKCETYIEINFGHIYYYQNGKLYREDGPAIEYSNGYKVYYLNGQLIANNQEEFERLKKLISFI